MYCDWVAFILALFLARIWRLWLGRAFGPVFANGGREAAGWKRAGQGVNESVLFLGCCWLLRVVFKESLLARGKLV
jgi:hypothetical protein